jgi:VanZ family protein
VSLSILSNRPRFLWLTVVAYMALIFGLSSISQTPAFVGGVDKYLHAVLYAGLAALLVRALAGGWRRRVTLGIVVATIAIAAAYGVSDEFHQSFVPRRSVEAMDVMADTIGAALAAFALFGWDIIRVRDDL